MEDLLEFMPPAYINNPHLTLPLQTEWFLYIHDFNHIDDREYYEFLDNRLTPYARQYHPYVLRQLIKYENNSDDYEEDGFHLGKVEIALLCDYIANPQMIDWVVVRCFWGQYEPTRKWHHPRRVEIFKFRRSLTETRVFVWRICRDIEKGSNFNVYPPDGHPYWGH